MNSIVGILSVSGSQFDAGVVHAGDAAATAPEGKPKLPDRVIGLLMALNALTAEEKTERDALVAERFEQNQRILGFVERALVSRRAGLKKSHEEAKAAVRQQQKFLGDLREQLVAGHMEAERSRNALTKARNELEDAARALQSLSRFSSSKDTAAAEQRVEAANAKVLEAERKAAGDGQALNFLKSVTIHAAEVRLDELMLAEARISEQLAGRDPILRELGIVVA